jgi:predicted benzoate:H+ symporter BenE
LLTEEVESAVVGELFEVVVGVASVVDVGGAFVGLVVGGAFVELVV